MRRLLLVATLAFTAIGISAWAQQPDFPAQDSGDAPDHGVARLSLINGNVSVAQGDSGELAGAAMNAPVVAGDRILTGDGSRAEVQFDGANLARLAPSTEVRMGDLQYHRYQVQIAEGLMTFRVLRDNDAQVEISTPSISVRPLRQGIYRVLVRADGTTEVTVRAGEAEAFSPRGSEPLHAGQALLARGSAYDPEIQTVAAYPSDDWDRWNADRDRFFERADASRYVSPDIYGTEDLAGYGRWTNDPAYGPVWVPTVDADWAPYREGRWSYVDYYGWTWISYDPWGWAPYHYGRWYRGGFGWAWYPGPVGPRYYWRPALVGFFGWGSPGFGVGYASFGFGNVGWVPLGPREPFRPWYGRGFNGGTRNFNVINNTNVVNVYQNARFTNAVTSVRAGDFGRTAVRGNNFVRASAGDLSRAGMVNGQMPFAPARESRQFGGGQINTSPINNQGMPRTSGNTRFFSAPSGGAGTRVQPAPQNNAPQNTGGWRRLDQASGGGAAAAAPSRPSFNPGVNAGGNQNFSSSPRQGFAPSYPPRDQQQPVRISPPIVNNRNESGFGGARGNGFGGPRPNGGGAGEFSAPRQPQRNFNPPPAPPSAREFNTPRQQQGNFNPQPAPPPPSREFRGGGGGGFSAPPAPPPSREFRGGGGGGSSPQRAPQGGGGGGGPHGGGGNNGGGGGHSNGGGHGGDRGGGRR